MQENGGKNPDPKPVYRVPYTYPYTAQELYECRDPTLICERGDFDPFAGMSPRTKAIAKVKRDAEIKELIKELDAMDTDSSDEDAKKRKKNKKNKKKKVTKKAKLYIMDQEDC